MKKGFSRNRPVWLLLAIALVAGGIYFWRTIETQPESATAPQSRSAPEFMLKDSKGVEHHLAELKGSSVIIHFWASWCAPCLDEMPRLVEFARALKGRNVKIVAISLDEKWEDANKVLDPTKLPENFISLLDLTKEVPDQYGTFQYPESYLLGPDLKIISKLVGSQDWSSPELKKAINDSLSSPSH